MKDAAYKIQDRYTQQHGLTIYPDCEECTIDDETALEDVAFDDNYCRVAEVKLKIGLYDYTGSDHVLAFILDSLSNTDFSNSSATGTTFLPTTKSLVHSGVPLSEYSPEIM